MSFKDEEKRYAGLSAYALLVDLMQSALDIGLVTQDELTKACAFAYSRYRKQRLPSHIVGKLEKPNLKFPCGRRDDDKL